MLSLFVLAAIGPALAARPVAPAASSPTGNATTRAAYGNLPLAFAPNRGQHADGVRYAAQGAGFGFLLSKEQALLAFTKGKRGAALALRFRGASRQVRIVGARTLPGKVNYLLGRDPSKWHTNLPTYGELRYRGLWPGIDLRLRGAKGQLKYEFHLRPGARVSDIRLAYRGASRISLARNGSLRIHTPLGVITDTAPRSYQLAGGKRVSVASRYALEGRRGYGFAVGRGYDPTRPLVIDPGLVYSTYLGGNGGWTDQGFGIAADASGHAYVTGISYAADFPTTPGAFDPTKTGFGDAFVTKLNPTGSALVYSTYLGGGATQAGYGIAVDVTGNAFVAGGTYSGDFPTTAGAFDTTHNGDLDTFVTKLSSSGSTLLYSTYLGGSSQDGNRSEIAIDPLGNAYVGGSTRSVNFPTTPGAFDTSLGGSEDAFVTKLNPTGSGLIYSTYLGGASAELGLGVAIDSLGNAYVTGFILSGGFPTTPGAFDTSFNGDFEAFATKLNATGSALVYSTYLGGSSSEEGFGIAVDAAGNAYVTGDTSSSNFPTTPGALDTSVAGTDAFVTKLNPTGSALLYSTYLGGSSSCCADQGFGIAVDVSGNAFVTGIVAATDFPTTLGAFDTTHNGIWDAFLTKLNPTGSAFIYSTYLGGSATDLGAEIALDAVGNAYVTGTTSSANFPTTPGAFDTTSSDTDAFVTKLDLMAACPPGGGGDDDDDDDDGGGGDDDCPGEEDDDEDDDDDDDEEEDDD